MSTTITEAFVQQYFSNVYMRAQQQVSKLRGLVELKSGVTGKRAAFDRIGQTEAQQAVTRHDNTPQMDTPHSRRWAVASTWRWADLVDSDDEVKTLIDPTNNYVRAGSYAMGRRWDRLIINAALGTATTGEDATATETWPQNGTQSGTSHQIAHGSAGLTLAKLVTAKKLLDAEDVEEEGRIMVISPDGLEDLLNDTTVTSRDYNTVQALVRGEIDSFLGFKFVRSTLLPKSGSTRSCLAFQQFGLGLAIGMDQKQRISERDDKNYATQVFFEFVAGAVRIDADRVVEVQITE